MILPAAPGPAGITYRDAVPDQSPTFDLPTMLEDLRSLVEVESPSHDLPAIAASAVAVAALVERRLGSPAELVDGPAGPHVHWRPAAIRRC